MARRAVSTVNAGNPFLTLSHLEYRNEFFPPHKGRASSPRYADGIPPVPVLHRSRSPWNLFDASLILEKIVETFTVVKLDFLPVE